MSWVRYRINYGTGRWTRWHALQGRDRTVCGCSKLPLHRLEIAKRRPATGICAHCAPAARVAA